jgi:tetratricopeptide (TPR) repeat protein
VPSLNNLEKFRNLFRDIGDEARGLASQGLAFEDLPLPDAVGADAEHEITQQDIDNIPGFDINSLFEDSPDDLAELFADIPDFDNSAQSEDIPNTPDDLVVGDLADFDAPTQSEDIPDNNTESPGEFSLDDLPDFDNPAQSEDIPKSDTESPGELSLDDLPDFGAPAQSEDIPNIDDVEPPDDFALDDLPDFGAPPQNEDIPNTPDDSPDFGKAASDTPFMNEESPSSNEGITDKAEPFDNDEGRVEDPFDAGAMEDDEPPPLLDAGVSDLFIPGLDVDDVPSAKRGKGNEEKQEFTASDDIEEINLTEGEYEHLRNSLVSFPLNLRIICEEIIAEQAVAPELMSRFIKLLVKEAPIQEVVDLAGKIQGRIINIPKGFEKKSGEELEAEKSSFSYLFIHKFLPVFGWTLFIGAVMASLLYLGYRFVWTPLYAESIYDTGYKRIGEGQYEDANTKFDQAFSLHPIKKWFPRYAEAFIAKRQYIHAEKKYDDLLKYYPKEKQGALDYASLETNILQNYEKADSILRKYILDFNVRDKEALLAIGDNALLWGDVDPSKYETAREAYAQYIEAYGQSPQALERMLKYFIRTDNLKEALPLKDYFVDTAVGKKRDISPETLAELAGYLFDKQFTETEGVPDEYISSITGVRDLLLKAVEEGPGIPEAHYNLSRYYHYFDNTREERSTLEWALPLFDSAPDTSRRLKKRIDAEHRFAQVLIKNKEFFASEEHLQKGIRLYEDGLSRKLLSPSPDLASLYASMGDLNYFTKENDWDMALEYYRRAEQGGWNPPEMLYRMGAAFYHQREWASAQEKFVDAVADLPLNRRILSTLGNISFLRGDYFAAEGYYDRLLKTLNENKNRFSELSPYSRPDHYALAERLMVAQNNMGVVMEALAERTGNPSYKDRSLSHYIDSQRAWDSLTRNPTTFVRVGVTDLSTPGVNLAYLNSQNALSPQPEFEPQIYMEIDKDVLEPSEWEQLALSTARLTEPLN